MAQTTCQPTRPHSVRGEESNLDTLSPRDLAPPLLRLAQAQLSFGSYLLRSAHLSDIKYQTMSLFITRPDMVPWSYFGSELI
jgi:hypothetical protein